MWYIKDGSAKGREHHKMDICPCGKSGLDLEEEYSRMMGAYLPLLKLKEGETEWKIIVNNSETG